MNFNSKLIIGGVFVMIPVGILLYLLIAKIKKIWPFAEDVVETTDNVGVDPGNDVISISQSGSKRETYILANEQCEREEKPGYCSELFNDTKYTVYAYEKSIDFDKQHNDKNIKGAYDRTGSLGPDGVMKCNHVDDVSCFYLEKVDSDGKITGIENNNGEDIIQVMVDAIYDGKYSEDSRIIKSINDDKIMGKIRFDFETGELSLDDKKAIPGENFPLLIYIAIVTLVYKLNDKPKPTFKLDFKPKTLRDIIIASGGPGGK